MIRHTCKIILLMFLLLFFASQVHADALSKADLAVANILFDFDGSDQFASYRVNDDGFVDIVFESNMPDKIYGDLLTRLQNHPDINGVLSGKGGPACQVDSWKADGAETISIPDF